MQNKFTQIEKLFINNFFSPNIMKILFISFISERSLIIKNRFEYTISIYEIVKDTVQCWKFVFRRSALHGVKLP